MCSFGSKCRFKHEACIPLFDPDEDEDPSATNLTPEQLPATSAAPAASTSIVETHRVTQRVGSDGKPLPGRNIVTFRELRTLLVRFANFRVPTLDLYGFESAVQLSGESLTDTFAFHVRGERSVSLPDTLIAETMAWWAGRARTQVEYDLSIKFVSFTCRELDITPEQQFDAVTYVPLMAYIATHRVNQMTRRLVTNSYCCPSRHAQCYDCVAQTRRLYGVSKHSALSTTTSVYHQLIDCAAQRCSANHDPETHVGPDGSIEPPQRQSMEEEPLLQVPTRPQRAQSDSSNSTSVFASPVEPPEPALVGVELNPGPGFLTTAQVDKLTEAQWRRIAADLYGDSSDDESMSEDSDDEESEPPTPAPADVPAPRLVGVHPNPGPSSHWSSVFWRSTTSLFGYAPPPLATRQFPLCLSNAKKPRAAKVGAFIAFDPTKCRPNRVAQPFGLCKGVQECLAFDAGGFAPIAFASNAHNEQKALDARVIAKTLTPTAALKDCIAFAKKHHEEFFPKMHKVVAVAWDEYILRTNASPSVKAALERTMLELHKQGINAHSRLTSAVIHKYTKRGGFTKVENNLYRTPWGEFDKAPRLIQSGSLEYIALVGPWIMALQDLVKRRWNEEFNIMFTSGKTTEQTAEFITAVPGLKLEDDIGKFDTSVGVEWCNYEVWLATKFGAPLAVRQLMHANIKTHGTTTCGWKYKVPGTRKSGDPFTSVFNSIINGLSHAFLFCRASGLTPKEARERRLLRMIVQGDDNVLVHAPGYTVDWVAGMAELGFESVALYRQHYEDIEFCSSRLYDVGGKYVFGPKPGRVLAKLGYIIDRPAGVSPESMVRGIAMGLRNQCNHIPPVRVVIDRLLELTSGHKAYYKSEFVEHKMTSGRLYECNSDIALSLDRTYGWSPTHQAQFAAKVATMQLGDDYSGTHVELLFRRDTSGPLCAA